MTDDADTLRVLAKRIRMTMARDEGDATPVEIVVIQGPSVGVPLPTMYASVLEDIATRLELQSPVYRHPMEGFTMVKDDDGNEIPVVFENPSQAASESSE